MNVFTIKQENEDLKRALDLATQERDDWKEKAIAISHMLTYACEQAQRHGIVAVKNE